MTTPRPPFAWHPHADEAGALPGPYTIQDGEEVLYDGGHIGRDLSRWHPRAVDLPDWRDALVDAWAPGGPYTRMVPWLKQASAGGVAFVPRWEWMNLCDAQLWLVGADMCDLVAAAAPTMPTTVMHPDLVPDPSGLVVFQTPVAGIDADGRGEGPCLTGAMLWGPAVLAEGMTPMLGITVYGPIDGPPWLAPLGMVAWPYGHDCDDPLPEFTGPPNTPERIASTSEDRRRLLALWLLSSQPGLVAPSEPRVPNRAVARRAERAGRVAPRVRVIELRRPPPRDHDAPRDTGRTYRHRWAVAGHWRNQAFGPKYGQRRPIYINPYLKGPAGAPLLHPAEVVKQWTR